MKWKGKKDIMDINEKMIGKLIPPMGKQLLFLQEQGILKDSSSLSVLDTQPEGGIKSQPTHDAVEASTSTPVSSICGEQSSSSLTDTLLSDEEEVSQPPHTVINDETSAELWNDLCNYK